MHKISIVITVYNIEKYINKCLESVINQSYRNLEIIIINDGSSDNSLEICKKYQSQDSRIILVDKLNTGVSDSRNEGIKLATGEYVMFIDGDDWIEYNTCQILSDFSENYNTELLLWSYINEYGSNQVKKRIVECSEDFLIFDEKQTKSFIQRRVIGPLGEELKYPEKMDNIVTVWNKLYKTSIIKRNNIKFIDTDIIGTEDCLFNIHYLQYVTKSVYINKFLYHYRRNNINSITRTREFNLFKRWKKLFEEIDRYINKHNLDENFKKALNNRICCSLIGLGFTIDKLNISLIKKSDKLKEVLSDSTYNEAFNNFKLKDVSIKWKIFFFLAKYKKTLSLSIMISLMNNIRKVRG